MQNLEVVNILTLHHRLLLLVQCRNILIEEAHLYLSIFHNPHDEPKYATPQEIVQP